MFFICTFFNFKYEISNRNKDSSPYWVFFVLLKIFKKVCKKQTCTYKNYYIDIYCNKQN